MDRNLAEPPWSGVGRRIESMCRKALYEYDLVDSGVVGVALSGGKDSLTMLIMLRAISGRGMPKFGLHAFFVGGEFSCGAGVEEAYLREICGVLGVELTVLTSSQKRETLACYRCSRERRSLIFRAAKERGIERVAFGHHRDDSNQTLLMNLLHKGEFAANLAKIHMYDYGVTIIRPLIFVEEEEIRKFSRTQGFARIMCQCPVGQDSQRRKVEDLIMQIEEIFPNVRKNLGVAGRKYGSKKAEKR
jgi:tRNA 2-thiocytidine biosynthesis protein TtcA